MAYKEIRIWTRNVKRLHNKIIMNEIVVYRAQVHYNLEKINGHQVGRFQEVWKFWRMCNVSNGTFLVPAELTILGLLDWTGLLNPYLYCYMVYTCRSSHIFYLSLSLSHTHMCIICLMFHVGQGVVIFCKLVHNLFLIYSIHVRNNYISNPKFSWSFCNGKTK